MPIVLRDVMLWDGVRPGPRPRMEVLIEGDRIAAVQPAGTTAAADGEVLDLDGAFVMPGLVDMHVHLVWSGGADPASVVAAEGLQLTTVRAVGNAQAELDGGITTVRDLGGNWDIPITLSRAVERGHVRGPRIIAAGKTIIMTGGHDPFWGIPSDGPLAVLHAVRRQVSLGAGVIKVAATGGVYGRPEGEDIGQTELSYEELAMAASEAHRRGLKVAAHALGTEGIGNAVRAGIDTIEHGNFLTEELVAAMRERGTALCPTLWIYRAIAENPAGAIPAYAVAKAQRAVAAHRDSFRMALEAGIPLVAGTDAGSCTAPHPVLVAELELMHAYGMPVEQVLLAATRTAAEVLGRSASMGTLEPGKQADVLVLDGNPLEDLGQLRAVRHVLRAGRFVAPGVSRPVAPGDSSLLRQLASTPG